MKVSSLAIKEEKKNLFSEENQPLSYDVSMLRNTYLLKITSYKEEKSMPVQRTPEKLG
jgi:hypothetical protein